MSTVTKHTRYTAQCRARSRRGKHKSVQLKRSSPYMQRVRFRRYLLNKEVQSMTKKELLKAIFGDEDDDEDDEDEGDTKPSAETPGVLDDEGEPENETENEDGVDGKEADATLDNLAQYLIPADIPVQPRGTSEISTEDSLEDFEELPSLSTANCSQDEYQTAKGASPASPTREIGHYSPTLVAYDSGGDSREAHFKVFDSQVAGDVKDVISGSIVDTDVDMDIDVDEYFDILPSTLVRHVDYSNLSVSSLDAEYSAFPAPLHLAQYGPGTPSVVSSSSVEDMVVDEPCVSFAFGSATEVVPPRGIKRPYWLVEDEVTGTPSKRRRISCSDRKPRTRMDRPRIQKLVPVAPRHYSAFGSLPTTKSFTINAPAPSLSNPSVAPSSDAPTLASSIALLTAQLGRLTIVDASELAHASTSAPSISKPLDAPAVAISDTFENIPAFLCAGEPAKCMHVHSYGVQGALTQLKASHEDVKIAEGPRPAHHASGNDGGVNKKHLDVDFAMDASDLPRKPSRPFASSEKTTDPRLRLPGYARRSPCTTTSASSGVQQGTQSAASGKLPSATPLPRPPVVPFSDAFANVPPMLRSGELVKPLKGLAHTVQRAVAHLKACRAAKENVNVESVVGNMTTRRFEYARKT
ncbi:hypothetical protein CONPUDRAFT_147246 [Coniophora puteana RWD-64-598 SS2]|uniref:Uncharacterized protein n=1 Tax=Coniophora puteana (strain RWD-64-598) TaxID=741705 RepID=A0A5M3M954_CONPW|nr:uncharacterized protein CONPUDRAFT_147246 [Coniophora puteana RWD-64-598 SS2]EIW75738.1 hypothetical protein CONPUDRAFT_147246 [Coniophora puteana RWD-64-598 SS2]